MELPKVLRNQAGAQFCEPKSHNIAKRENKTRHLRKALNYQRSLITPRKLCVSGFCLCFFDIFVLFVVCLIACVQTSPISFPFLRVEGNRRRLHAGYCLMIRFKKCSTHKATRERERERERERD